MLLFRFFFGRSYFPVRRGFLFSVYIQPTTRRGCRFLCNIIVIIIKRTHKCIERIQLFVILTRGSEMMILLFVLTALVIKQAHTIILSYVCMLNWRLYGLARASEEGSRSMHSKKAEQQQTIKTVRQHNNKS